MAFILKARYTCSASTTLQRAVSYTHLFACVAEETAEEVAELLKTGAGRGFSWVLQKSVNMTQRGSVVALYTANAAKYLKDVYKRQELH